MLRIRALRLHMTSVGLVLAAALVLIPVFSLHVGTSDIVNLHKNEWIVRAANQRSNHLSKKSVQHIDDDDDDDGDDDDGTKKAVGTIQHNQFYVSTHAKSKPILSHRI